MLDQGYSLEAIEILNWGNFHGLQVVPIRDVQNDGLLFSAPPASAIIGINGSGKSTLIDGLMMTLLPFENLLKLGVTNDVESGASGGRTIRDYVLGKFSSAGDDVASDLGGVFGRKEGCSIFLVRFRHNSQINRTLTLGRIWWYQNYRVSDTQVAFLHYDYLTIDQLCEGRVAPKGPKGLRDYVRQAFPSLQVFDTMTNYFMSLGTAFGGVTRDDFKILNRAFYVKSISQIDQFIRENMLIEQDNPQLGRLIENVESGQEIASSIETCNKKIQLIERILGHLHKTQSISEKKANILSQQSLMSVYKEWLDIKTVESQIESDTATLHRHESLRPDLEIEVRELSSKWDRLQQQVLQQDVGVRLKQVDTELRHHIENQERLQCQKERYQARAELLKVKVPARPEDWDVFFGRIQKQMLQTQEQVTHVSLDLEKQREIRVVLDAEQGRLSEELEHLSRIRSLIPKDLYEIKDAAIDELGIPAEHLFFVGELIQVKSEYKDYRRAIESVFFPISRNLLCHPDDLNTLTKWLDNKGLKSDVTVKRISQRELASDAVWSDVDHGGDRVLQMIEVLPKNENPFFGYLWKWLLDVFDYRLVQVARFKSDEARLVTKEGLVKTDNRTFRKLKNEMSFSLGWDNREAIERLTQKSVQIKGQLHQVRTNIELGSKTLQSLDETRQGLGRLIEDGQPEFLVMSKNGVVIESLQSERAQLLKANPDFLKLKREIEELTISRDVATGRLSECRAQIQQVESTLQKIRNLVTVRRQQLVSSFLYSELCLKFESEDGLTSALSALHEKLEKTNKERLEYERELQTQIEALGQQYTQAVTRGSQELESFRREFNDPNMMYVVTENRIHDLMNGWQGLADRLKETELPDAQDKWRKFFDQVLLESVKDTINEIKAKAHETLTSIQSINEVLKLTNFEDLPDEKRYLRIDILSSQDERVRKFKRQMDAAEKILGPAFRSQVETQSETIMKTLADFVGDLRQDVSYRLFVTDVRNHFQFKVQSLRRGDGGADVVMETFTGARRDAKSSAQTTQLAYALLASSLAFRFRFHDPIRGKDTPRLLILDEFGGKFDNEKPKEILKLLSQMGFQSILVSPMSKADLLSEHVSHMVMVHKVSASQSKVRSLPIASREDYEKLVKGRSSEARP